MFCYKQLNEKKNIQKTENNFINLKWLPSWQIGANINLIRPFLSTLILVIHGTWEALNILVLISAFSAVNRYKKIKNVHQDIVKAWNFRKCPWHWKSKTTWPICWSLLLSILQIGMGLHRKKTFFFKSINTKYILFRHVETEVAGGGTPAPPPRFLLKLTFYQLKMIVKRKK